MKGGCKQNSDCTPENIERFPSMKQLCCSQCPHIEGCREGNNLSHPR